MSFDIGIWLPLSIVVLILLSPVIIGFIIWVFMQFKVKRKLKGRIVTEENKEQIMKEIWDEMSRESTENLERRKREQEEKEKKREMAYRELRSRNSYGFDTDWNEESDGLSDFELHDFVENMTHEDDDSLGDGIGGFFD